MTGQSYGAPQHASTSRDQWVSLSRAREAQQCDPSNVERGPIGSRSALRAPGNSLVQAATSGVGPSRPFSAVVVPLWHLPPPGADGARLDDGGGPVPFFLLRAGSPRLSSSSSRPTPSPSTTSVHVRPSAAQSSPASPPPSRVASGIFVPPQQGQNSSAVELAPRQGAGFVAIVISVSSLSLNTLLLVRTIQDRLRSPFFSRASKAIVHLFLLPSTRGISRPIRSKRLPVLDLGASDIRSTSSLVNPNPPPDDHRTPPQQALSLRQLSYQPTYPS